MGSRRVNGLIIGCIAVLIALFVVNYIDYVKRDQKLRYVLHDIRTITAGDYTIEFNIGPNFFNRFLETKKEAWERECAAYGRIFKSSVQSFRGWIESEIEKLLSRQPALGFEN